MLNKINISPGNRIDRLYRFDISHSCRFWQVNQYDLINYDDNVYVLQNGHIRSGITLDGFCWVITKYYGLWNPLVWLSFMFDYHLHGLNAGGYHLTNLILHILSALLLFWLFNRMTGAIWKSAFVAAFFRFTLCMWNRSPGFRRKDVLSAFFWMLTLCLYVYYTENRLSEGICLLCFPLSWLLSASRWLSLCL